MGNRLSQIATRTGDAGTTGLGDGSRVDKDHLRICALGDVDELNSFVGLLANEDLPDEVRADLSDIQHDLFDLGGELAIPGYTMIADKHTESAFASDGLARWRSACTRSAVPCRCCTWWPTSCAIT